MKCPASVLELSPVTLFAGELVKSDRTAVEQAAIETIYRKESARVLATLIHLLGSFDLAEEATRGVCDGARTMAKSRNAENP